MIKRAFDVAASALALLLLCPLFLLVALAIKLDSAGPALFKQTRVGRHFRSFTIYKFRTMSANAAGREITVGADPRITWAKYTISNYPAGHAAFSSQANARNAVRTERRLELAMEGQRTFDLRRWGLLETTMNAYFAKEKERLPHLAAAIAVTERHRLYPIPNIQIELSKVGGANTPVFAASSPHTESCHAASIWKWNGAMSSKRRASTKSSGSVPVSAQ